VAEAAGQGKK
jgi:hypothetical protein